MSSDWQEKYVRCPLYKKLGKCSIVCEGCVGTNAEQRFRNNRERDRHFGLYCKGKYEGCLQFRGVSKKYE